MTDPARLLILADDFTGACDAAGAFAAARGTLVVHGAPGQWPADVHVVEVLGVDLDLRERLDADAEALTGATAQHLCAAYPERRVFLKIDSTVRGPIAGLVAGALAGSGRHVAVIAPAFPEQGRLLRNGRLVLDGWPGASLTDALGMERTALLGADFARSADQVEVAVEHARNRGARHVVVDADQPECLQSVAQAWRRHTRDWLLVGSAGLSRQVANSAEQPATTPHLHFPRHAPGSGAAAGGPVLVVAGSPAAATQAQLDQLRGRGRMVLIGPDMPPPAAPSSNDQLLVLCTTPAAERDAGQSAQAVAATTAAWAKEFTPSALVIAGGTTARLVCEGLGAHGVRLEGEFEPGIPFGHLVGGAWDGVPVVTKAGGFGTPDTLLDVVRALGVSSIAERTT